MPYEKEYKNRGELLLACLVRTYVNIKVTYIPSEIYSGGCILYTSLGKSQGGGAKRERHQSELHVVTSV